jgi:hypothetical protein
MRRKILVRPDNPFSEIKISPVPFWPRVESTKLELTTNYGASGVNGSFKLKCERLLSVACNIATLFHNLIH